MQSWRRSWTNTLCGDPSSDLKSGKTSVKECKEALLMCSKGSTADAGRPERKEQNKEKSKEMQGCIFDLWRNCWQTSKKGSAVV